MIPAQEEYVVPVQDVDLAVSLRAWGFDFPVETYLPAVMRAMRPGAWLIIDVRPDTGGEDALQKAGLDVNPVKQKLKYKRLACRKPE